MPEIALQPVPSLSRVTGTAQPLHGASGALRRVAYGVPEHYPRRWLLLLLADRIDFVEQRLADPARRRLAGALAAVAVGALLGTVIVRRWR
jgi:hypothetical protein